MEPSTQQSALWGSPQPSYVPLYGEQNIPTQQYSSNYSIQQSQQSPLVEQFGPIQHDSFWERIRYPLAWGINFLLSLVVTVILALLLLYWPMVFKEVHFWWKTNYQPATEQNQQTVINAIYPDQISGTGKSSDKLAQAEPNIPIIPPDNRIVISKIEVNAPIIQVTDKSEQGVLKTIESGVGWYPDTGKIGSKGNTVLTGHSSYFWWKPGEYKFIFSNLYKLPVGDTITVYSGGKKYDYTIYNSKVVEPTTSEAEWIFDQQSHQNESIVTLITCHPPGTALKRLILQARLTTPISTQNSTKDNTNTTTTDT
ncbi:MAG: sortase, partial [bacterium]